MTVKRRRDRVVVFRLTEEEYDGLRRICEAKSGRSLSEFARSEILGSMRLAEVALPAGFWETIECRVAALESSLVELVQRFDTLAVIGAQK
jgi:hypothetical protein